MASSVIEILNSKNFTDHVSARKELTIVQFHDEDNASCHIMDTVFKKLQEFYAGRVVCYAVCKPAASEIWEQFKIYQTPSYLLIKENRAVEKLSGLISYDSFISVVERWI